MGKELQCCWYMHMFLGSQEQGWCVSNVITLFHKLPVKFACVFIFNNKQEFKQTNRKPPSDS